MTLEELIYNLQQLSAVRGPKTNVRLDAAGDCWDANSLRVAGTSVVISTEKPMKPLTVGELKEHLSRWPDRMPVAIEHSHAVRTAHLVTHTYSVRAFDTDHVMIGRHEAGCQITRPKD